MATAFAAGLPIMIAVGSLDTGTVAALAIGSLLPDIDHPHSLIGRKTRGVSDAVNAIAGHRGFTHWLIGAATAVTASISLYIFAEMNLAWVIAFSAGYLFHLFVDSFSKSGICWLEPFKSKAYKPGGSFSYKTGGLAERVIGTASFLAAAIIAMCHLAPSLKAALSTIFGDFTLAPG